MVCNWVVENMASSFACGVGSDMVHNPTCVGLDMEDMASSFACSSSASDFDYVGPLDQKRPTR